MPHVNSRPKSIASVNILRARSGPTFGVGSNNFRYYTPSFNGHAFDPTESTILYRNSKNKRLKVGYVIQDDGNGELIVEEVARSRTKSNNVLDFIGIWENNLGTPIIRRLKIERNLPKTIENNHTPPTNMRGRSLDYIMHRFNDNKMKAMANMLTKARPQTRRQTQWQKDIRKRSSQS